eukprot:scaffold41084_cov19-Tisochrysis_lutea.AAC.8
MKRCSNEQLVSAELAISVTVGRLSATDYANLHLLCATWCALPGELSLYQQQAAELRRDLMAAKAAATSSAQQASAVKNKKGETMPVRKVAWIFGVKTSIIIKLALVFTKVLLLWVLQPR